MRRSRRFPTWLVRRGYFRRIERWASLRTCATSSDIAHPEPDAPPSNVVPFADPRSGTRQIPFAERRGAGTG